MFSSVGLFHPLTKNVDRSSLASALEKLRAFLQSDAAVLLTGADLQDYLARSTRLLDSAHVPGEVLYVGVVGGTGVGKSTLINALAGEKISDSSDRRPFTDRAVVYRHRNTPRGLEDISHLLKENDATHENEAIQHLVLLDLPDFDSHEKSNRETVLTILPKLDCIVWVVSPEKYADAGFYSLVAQTTLHQENFTFILNKADELLEHEDGDPLERMKAILGDLTIRLKHEGGISHPRLFSISALAAFRVETGAGIFDGEFGRFRDDLMVRRDSKDIASVKTKNLIEEAQRLMKDLDAQVRPHEKQSVLNSLVQTRSDSSMHEKRSTSEPLPQEKELAQSLARLLAIEDWSIGPVKLAMRLVPISFIRGPNVSVETIQRIFESAATILTNERLPAMERESASVDSELLLAFGQTEAGAGREKPDRLVAAATLVALRQFNMMVEHRRQGITSKFSRLKRLCQKILLTLPGVLMMVKLTGLQTIEAWVNAPNLGGAISIALAIGTSLFSSEGLVGLIVLLMLEILLLYRLAARRLRKIDHEAKAMARAAMTDLEERLEQTHKRISENRNRMIGGIQLSLGRLEELKMTFFPATGCITASNDAQKVG
jgi:hypothetical protein